MEAKGFGGGDSLFLRGCARLRICVAVFVLLTGCHTPDAIVVPKQREEFQKQTTMRFLTATPVSAMPGPGANFFTGVVGDTLKGLGVTEAPNAEVTYTIRSELRNTIIFGMFIVEKHGVRPYINYFACPIERLSPKEASPREDRLGVIVKVDPARFEEVLDNFLDEVYGARVAAAARAKVRKEREAKYVEEFAKRREADRAKVERIRSFKIGETTEAEFLKEGWGNPTDGWLGILNSKREGSSGAAEYSLGWFDSIKGLKDGFTEKFFKTTSDGMEMKKSVPGAQETAVCRVRFEAGILKDVSWSEVKR